MSQKELVLILTCEAEIFSSIQYKNAWPYKTDFFSVVRLHPNSLQILTPEIKCFQMIY